MNVQSQNDKAIMAIMAIVSQLKYGNISTNFVIHNGVIRALKFHTCKKNKYNKTDLFVTPIRDVVNRLAEGIKKKETSEITIKINIKEGTITAVEFDNTYIYSI